MSIGVAVIAAAALTINGAAQTPPDASMRATLLQISVENASMGVRDVARIMAEETAQITSCANGLKLSERLKARGLHGRLSYDVKSNVPIEALPTPLREAVRTLPVGRATPVFGTEQALRVLVRCETTFVMPGSPPRLAPARPPARKAI